MGKSKMMFTINGIMLLFLGLTVVGVSASSYERAAERFAKMAEDGYTPAQVDKAIADHYAEKRKQAKLRSDDFRARLKANTPGAARPKAKREMRASDRMRKPVAAQVVSKASICSSCGNENTCWNECTMKVTRCEPVASGGTGEVHWNNFSSTDKCKHLTLSKTNVGTEATITSKRNLCRSSTVRAGPWVPREG